MTISFEIDNDVIVYALEKIISYARNNQYIFLAQSVWWISSILGLQEGLIIHIDNLKARANIRKSDSQDELPIIHPDRVANFHNSKSDSITSDGDTISTTEAEIDNEVINNCKAFLEQSRQQRKSVERFARQTSRVDKRKANKEKPLKTYGTQTEGIDGSELRRRKAAGECHRCAWPRDRKGSHKTLDCHRGKKVEKGTAQFPKKKQYSKD
jgi:hypothetical protein